MRGSDRGRDGTANNLGAWSPLIGSLGDFLPEWVGEARPFFLHQNFLTTF